MLRGDCEEMSNLLTIPSKCTGCTACVSSCPKEAITMRMDREGFEYPVIDKQKCIRCGICKKICPTINPIERKIGISTEETLFAAMQKDGEVRKKSSSGGAFYAFAMCILKQGGVVWAASIEENGTKVTHICIENECDIDRILGSKYVQSNLDGVFKCIKGKLLGGKKVLFAGTPCQVAGLYSYLRGEYENLYTVDFVCHGVPSPGVWKCYADKRASENRNGFDSISFRDKVYGWKKYSLTFTYMDRTKSSQMVTEDQFLRGFIQNMIIRKSCYKCSYRKLVRSSDLTLADCWGAEYFLPEYNDDLGISAVLVHSKKGLDLCAQAEGLVRIPLKLNDFLRYNPSLTDGIMANANRKYFFDRFAKGNCDIDDLLRICNSRITIVGRLRQKVYRMKNSIRNRRLSK